mgnify:FL=1
MKKTFISGIFITILGAILFGLGILHHGDRNLIWQNGGFKIENTSMNRTSFKDVRALKIDTIDDVQIKSYNGTQVKVLYRATNTPNYNAKNHQLSISGNSRSEASFNLGLGNFTSSTIVIYVPSNSNLEKLTCTTSDGISISDLNFNQLHLSSDEDIDLHRVNVKNKLQIGGYTDLELDDVSAASLDYETGDGDVTIRDSKFIKDPSKISTQDGDVELRNASFKQLKVNSSDGDIDLSNLNVLQSLDGHTDDGDIDVSLKDSSDVSINADDDDGEISLFGRDTNYYYHGSPKVRYSFESSDGDITIR